MSDTKCDCACDDNLAVLNETMDELSPLPSPTPAAAPAENGEIRNDYFGCTSWLCIELIIYILLYIFLLVCFALHFHMGISCASCLWYCVRISWHYTFKNEFRFKSETRMLGQLSVYVCCFADPFLDRCNSFSSCDTPTSQKKRAEQESQVLSAAAVLLPAHCHRSLLELLS